MEAALICTIRRTDMTKVTGALGAMRKRLKTTEVIKLHYVPEPGLINYLTFLHENITDRPVGHNNSPELHRAATVSGSPDKYSDAHSPYWQNTFSTWITFFPCK